MLSRRSTVSAQPQPLRLLLDAVQLLTPPPLSCCFSLSILFSVSWFSASPVYKSKTKPTVIKSIYGFICHVTAVDVF